MSAHNQPLLNGTDRVMERRWWMRFESGGIDSASAWYFEPIFADFETLDFRIKRSRRQP
jgi:hypothetical protein